MVHRLWILILLFCFIESSFAQNKVLFQIHEESGETLPGVNVIIKGTTTGTITNDAGQAALSNLPDGKFEIEISFVGFKRHRIGINLPRDNEKIFEITLIREEEELEEVVIAATRSSRSIEDIPTRIEAVTAEELGEKAAMNSSNIGMLLSETTGVQMQQTSLGSGNLSIRIQGLDGRYTQILKDGFPLYGGFAGGLSIMQIPPLDLKQVELIKGSNSTLYGGGAIAGLVNLVSIQPEEKPELSVMFNQTSVLGSTVNLFYAEKYGKTGMTLYGSASNQFAFDTDGDDFSNLPKTETFIFNPKFYLYPGEKTVINFGINTSFDNRIGGNMQSLKNGNNAGNLFTEKNISNRVASQFHFQNHTEKRTLSFKNSISYFDRNLTIPDYNFDGKQLSGFSEGMISLNLNSDMEWQIGANHYFENFTEEHPGESVPRNYSHNTIGGFVQNTTGFSQLFTLEGGLRIDYNFNYGSFVLPRLAFLLKPKQNLTLRFGGAAGYKLPTMFTEEAEKYYYRGIDAITSANMKAETSLGGNFDINYRASFSESMTFSINQMFYLTRLRNPLILRDNAAQNSFFFENANDDVISSGFETNLKLNWNDFKLYANYAFVNAKLKYDDINRQKPLTPKHNLGFALLYEEEEKWTVGYELYYTGTQFDNLYNKKPDFWIMGFMVLRSFEKLSVFINFENFTNVIQTKFEPLLLPPYSNPVFPDIWAPSDGFVFNGGFRYRIF